MTEPKIYFIDTSFGCPSELSEADAAAREKKLIESEFGLSLRDANIGAGADCPAFLLNLNGYAPIVAAVILFFQGKRINDNLDAWVEIGNKIKAFLKRPVHLNREAALLVAMHTFHEATGITPCEVQLLAYEAINQRFEKLPSSSDDKVYGIDTPPNEIDLSDVYHILRIGIDNSTYRFLIRGNSIEMELLENSQ